jgi:hypothetical protein
LLSARYHIASIVAIFLALGVGILIGGTLGQKWMVEAEHQVVGMLMAEIDKQAAINRELKSQIGSLQLMYRQIDPILERKKILWVRPENDAKKPMLTFMLQAVGAEWIEEVVDANGLKALLDKLSADGWPDMILTSDPNTGRMVQNALLADERSAGRGHPLVIDISALYPDLNDPEALVNFMMYLRQITVSEEEQHAYHDRYPGLE